MTIKLMTIKLFLSPSFQRVATISPEDWDGVESGEIISLDSGEFRVKEILLVDFKESEIHLEVTPL